MASNTLWVHGNAATFEHLVGVSHVSHVAAGLTGLFAVDGTAWVYIPLPTPTVLGGENAILLAIQLEIDMGEAQIGQLAINDGPNVIYKTENAAADGYGPATQKEIQYGVGVAFQILLEHGADDEHRKPTQITINAAGAEYKYPTPPSLPNPQP